MTATFYEALHEPPLSSRFDEGSAAVSDPADVR